MKAPRPRHGSYSVGGKRLNALVGTQCRISKQRDIARSAGRHVRQRPANIAFAASPADPNCCQSCSLRHARERREAYSGKSIGPSHDTNFVLGLTRITELMSVPAVFDRIPAKSVSRILISP